MLTFLFLNQTLWCYHSLESSRRDDFNEGHIIGSGGEMRKLSWKPFCSLFLNCNPATSYVTQDTTLMLNHFSWLLKLTKECIYLCETHVTTMTDVFHPDSLYHDHSTTPTVHFSYEWNYSRLSLSRTRISRILRNSKHLSESKIHFNCFLQP